MAENYPPRTHGEYIYFGTGDREDPGNTAVVNRFYAVKNDWTATSPLTESNLVDVTSDLIQLGTAAQKQQAQTSLDIRQGVVHPAWKTRAKKWSPRRGSTRVWSISPPTRRRPPEALPTPTPARRPPRAELHAFTPSNYKTGAAVHEFQHERLKPTRLAIP